MLATRLVRLIESHAERLSHSVMKKLHHDPRCAELHNVPVEELEARSYELYRNLSEWLMGKSEHELQELYIEIGARRAQQEIPFSHVLWAINATKEHLWEFLLDEGVVTKPLELFGEMELFLLLERFFDRAVYYASVGYEQVEKPQKVAA